MPESQLIVKPGSATRLTHVSARHAVLEPLEIKTPGPEDVLVETVCSGISRGTESLVWNGNVPETEWETMRCPHQSGGFGFPITYGYASVGNVIETGRDVTRTQPGDRVFVLHPHQDRFVVSQDWINPLPETLTSERAVLTANAETALNACWDANAQASDRVAVIGAGVVGLLTALIVRKETGADVTLIDINEGKKPLAGKFAKHFSTPVEIRDAATRFDVIFNTSASESGLQLALDHASFEGRIIEMSWYGNKPVELSLGGRFHSQRLQIISSQVGSVSPARRAEITHAQRMQLAMKHLEDPALDHLLHLRIAFSNLPEALPQIFDPKSDALCPLITYIDRD